MALVRERLSQTEAANRLQVSTSWVRALTKRGILDRNPDGSYPWPRVAEQFESYQSESEPENTNGAEPPASATERRAELELERIRWTKEKADAQEMENAVRRGELIPAEHYLEALRLPLEACDQALRNAKRVLGRKWAKRLGVGAAEAMALIEDITEEARAHLRQALEDGDDAAA